MSDTAESITAEPVPATSRAPTPSALAALNALDRADFVAAVGSTFENAPWVAACAWSQRPFHSADALHGAMLGVVRRATEEVQLDFLRGHPELAGKEAEAGTMTDHSVGEQASAGLNALSPSEFAELAALNARYLDRHGFPFIVAVRRHDKQSIFTQLRQRTDNDRADELAEAIRQIGYITRLRINAKLG